MHVVVRPLGQLRYALPNRPRELRLELPAATTILDVVQHLALPRHLVWYANVNGETVDLDHTLGDGDEVVFYAPIVGGAGPG